MKALNIPAAGLRYRAMIGAGGIGSGVFFALNSNETLGREESRGGHFLDRRDYCKLHIISHYVGTLLGAGFAVIPVGRVGDDEAGARLLAEMGAAGLDTRYVERSPGLQTLFSFCFVYPDGSGGNMTTDDSACGRVDAAFVERAVEEFRRYAGSGIALAAPEAPIEARAAVLRLGTTHGFFRVASFTAEEIAAATQAGLLRQVDLLALNRDEAAAVAGLCAREMPACEIAARAVGKLKGISPAIWILLTAGGEGGWSWDGGQLCHLPALNVPVSNSAGAGDAHLAGVIAGLAAGLPLAGAHQLGALVAAVSVTSPHTIHPGIDRDLLRASAREYGAALNQDVRPLLGQPV